MSAQADVADVLIQPGDDPTPDPVAALAAIRTHRRCLRSPSRQQRRGSTSPAAKAHGSIRVDTLPADPRLRWFGLGSGQWPTHRPGRRRRTDGRRGEPDHRQHPDPHRGPLPDARPVTSSVSSTPRPRYSAAGTCRYSGPMVCSPPSTSRPPPSSAPCPALCWCSRSREPPRRRWPGDWPAVPRPVRADRRRAGRGRGGEVRWSGRCLTIVLLAFAGIALLVAGTW